MLFFVGILLSLNRFKLERLSNFEIWLSLKRLNSKMLVTLKYYYLWKVLTQNAKMRNIKNILILLNKLLIVCQFLVNQHPKE
jgi:hypothetical protein